MLDEDQVYLGVKNLLARANWILLGGQPPSGSNSLPVIEIKNPNMREKGSKDVYKPDIVAFRQGVILIVECKSDRDENDMNKLREILSTESRIISLYQEICQRSLFTRKGIDPVPNFKDVKFEAAIAHSGLKSPLQDLHVIIIHNERGEGEFIPAQG